MHEQISEPREFPPRNVLELFNDPEFTALLAETNVILSTITDPEEPTSDAEVHVDDTGIYHRTVSDLHKLADEKLQQLNTKYFGIDWLERPATLRLGSIDTVDEDTTDASHEINGQFMMAATVAITKNEIIDRDEVLYVDDMPQRRVAIALKVDDTIVLLPLDRHVIEKLEVAVPPAPNSYDTLLGVLLNHKASLDHLKSTETFNHKSEAQQNAQLDTTIDEMNTDFSTGLADDESIRIVSAKATGAIDTISAHKLHIIKSKKQGALALEVADTTNGRIATIPIDTIIDMFPEATHEKRSNDYIDLLDSFFSSHEIQEAITNAENAINYCNDDADYEEAILEQLDELAHLIPNEFFYHSVTATGRVLYVRYPEDEPDTLQCTEAEAVVTGDICNLDIKKVSGQWRVVLPIKLPRDHIDQSANARTAEAVYIIPSADFTRRLEAFSDATPIEDIEAIDFAQAAAESAEATRQLMRETRFKNATIHQQKTLLRDSIRPFEQLVKKATTHLDGEQIMVTAGNYYVIDADDVSTCQEIAESQAAVSSEPTTEIAGQSVIVDIPELSEPREKRLRGARDFPLSKGEPMLLIEDAAKELIYLVPASELRHLAKQSDSA